MSNMPDHEDRKLIIVLAGGAIALAKFMGGQQVRTSNKAFLDNCEELATEWVDRGFKAVDQNIPEKPEGVIDGVTK